MTFSPVPPPRPQRLWSEQDRSKVQRLLIDGATCGEVAREMHISRCAAIGRIHRDDELHELVNRPEPKPPAIERLKFKVRTSDRRLSSPKFSRVAFIDRTLGEPVQAMPLMDTGSTWCKWPVVRAPGVPGGILCCGAATDPLDVYCPCHRAMAREQ
jgi:GcrA cell cycle regulator